MKFKNSEDEQKASKNFAKISRECDEHNAKYDKGEVNFMMGVYDFNRWTSEEIVRSKMGLLEGTFDAKSHHRVAKRSLPQFSVDPLMCSNPPASKNWTAEGKVGPAQYQDLCNCCYVFASIGALESAVSIKTGNPPVKLSEQQLIECVRDPNQPSVYGGCNFGRAEWVYNYTKNEGGAVAYSAYNPYNANDTGTCNRNLPTSPDTLIDHWEKTPRGDEDTLKCYLAQHGPHSISMDFSSSSIMNYKEGIFDDPYTDCNSSFYLDTAVNMYRMYKPYNHAVLLVGYGTEIAANGSPTDFWLVRNSWGTSWGMNGYIKVARNKNNLCHVASDCQHPVLPETATTTSKINYVYFSFICLKDLALSSDYCNIHK